MLRYIFLIIISFIFCISGACAKKVLVGTDKHGKNRYAYTCENADCLYEEGDYMVVGSSGRTDTSCSSSSPTTYK